MQHIMSAGFHHDTSSVWKRRWLSKRAFMQRWDGRLSSTYIETYWNAHINSNTLPNPKSDLQPQQRSYVGSVL
jgi:hypothetical protein